MQGLETYRPALAGYLDDGPNDLKDETRRPDRPTAGGTTVSFGPVVVQEGLDFARSGQCSSCFSLLRWQNTFRHASFFLPRY